MQVLCIIIKGLPASTEAGNLCVESARKFGVSVETFDVTDRFESRGYWMNEGLFSRPDSFSTTTPGQGHGYWPGLEPGAENEAVMGCLASHYRLWKECVQLDEPIMVLEHDAIFIRPLPSSLEFDDVLNICFPGFGTPFEVDVTEGDSVIVDSPYPTIRGAAGYIVTPQGAAKLVAYTREGAMPADRMIHPGVVRLQELYPWPVIADTRFSSIANEDQGPRNHAVEEFWKEDVWKDYER